jgi:hypothetical protein
MPETKHDGYTSPADDYTSPAEALTAALEWASALKGTGTLQEVYFGQRNPFSVGPDRFYWDAWVIERFGNAMPQAKPESLWARVKIITDAWVKAFSTPEGDPG